MIKLKDSIKIGVVGVGGAGCNMISTLIESKAENVNIVGMNTDLGALNIACPNNKLQIGKIIAQGLGLGASNPELGKKAAVESGLEIVNAIKDYDTVILACGMGGGNGTGASPVIADLARDLGIYVVAIAERPAYFESERRIKNAAAGVEELKFSSDVLIEFPIDDVLRLPMFKDNKATYPDVLKKCNEIVEQTILEMVDILNEVYKLDKSLASAKTVIEVIHNLGYKRGIMQSEDSYQCEK